MSYFGAKGGAGVKERIISAQNEHDTYIELFLGSGVIMNSKPPAARSIGIEKNPETVAKYGYPEAAQIITGCAFDILEGGLDFSGLGRVLLYVDPPYLAETRKGGGEYGEYELSDEDHRRLLSLLQLRGSRHYMSIQISGYRSPLYDDMLKDWRRVDYRTMTHGGPVEESLWMNYAPGRPHWYDYAGENRTQRQQIKRKAARWAGNYQAMSFAERLAIRAALDHIDSSHN